MKRFKILRGAENPMGVFGMLMEIPFLKGNVVPFALTLERNWEENKQNVSCIPAGDYLCKRWHSAKHPNTFEITNVPNRSAILFHTGNLEEHSAGCILVGEEFGYLGDQIAVLSSKRGFNEFLQRTEGINEFWLSIVRAY